jgi:hypothetical protein
MNGLSVIETPAMLELIEKVVKLSDRVEAIHKELTDAKKPYLTAQEVMELAGFGKTWLNDNKQDIGYSIIGGQLRFKRKDFEAYMETAYFKTKRSKRLS